MQISEIHLPQLVDRVEAPLYAPIDREALEAQCSYREVIVNARATLLDSQTTCDLCLSAGDPIRTRCGFEVQTNGVQVRQSQSPWLMVV